MSINAGVTETLNEHGIWHVAKLLLVSTVQALLHDGRLQIQKDLPEAPILKLELEDFRATVTDSGRWTFGARSGAHDDLVLALALALWRASRRAPMYEQLRPEGKDATMGEVLMGRTFGKHPTAH